MTDRDLARAVLLQAIWDATSSKTTSYPKNRRPTRKEKEQAKDFLSGSKVYYERLKLWCDLCGISVDSVIEYGKRIKKGGKNGR